jgi:hypothetical protein
VETHGFAASFVNGDFETGNTSGWTIGAGSWFGGTQTAADYLPGGSQYNPSANASAIVTPGDDPVVGSLLNRVYEDGGRYSFRANNEVQNYSVGVISQTVFNYTDPTIFFAWAAVLQESHGPTDSGNFTLELRDDTAGDILYSVAYSSASAAGAGLFNEYLRFGYDRWFYTDWQVANLDVSARAGHDFTLSLLGSDCPYGGHAGYVYLDGFGTERPGEIPEPASFLLAGAGLAAVAVLKRRRSRSA